MNLTPEQRATGKANFQSQMSRRGFLKSSVAAGVVAGGSLGAFYYGYDSSHMDPIRVGVVGTGDEGNVLLGAINPRLRPGHLDCRHTAHTMFTALSMATFPARWPRVSARV